MTQKQRKEMANRIKQQRKSLKYTQESFSEMIGLSASSYTKIENAFQQPSLDTLIQISQYLHLSLDELVFGVVEKEEENLMADILLDRLDLLEEKDIKSMSLLLESMVQYKKVQSEKIDEN